MYNYYIVRDLQKYINASFSPNNSEFLNWPIERHDPVTSGSPLFECMNKLKFINVCDVSDINDIKRSVHKPRFLVKVNQDMHDFNLWSDDNYKSKAFNDNIKQPFLSFISEINNNDIEIIFDHSIESNPYYSPNSFIPQQQWKNMVDFLSNLDFKNTAWFISSDFKNKNILHDYQDYIFGKSNVDFRSIYFPTWLFVISHDIQSTNRVEHKLFSFTSRITKPHRFILASLLAECGLFNQGHVSFYHAYYTDKTKKQIVDDVMNSLINYGYEDSFINRVYNAYINFIKYKDIELDITNASHQDNFANGLNQSLLYPYLRCSDFIIVNETYHDNMPPFITEKSMLPIIAKKPFIVNGSTGHLQAMQYHGFCTFPELFNESYDKDIGKEHRYLTILNNVRQWANASGDIKNHCFNTQKILEKVEYNYWRYFHDTKSLIESTELPKLMFAK